MRTKELAAELKDYGISLRRTFHQHPELGREEYETAKRIEAELDAMGIPHSRLGGTGVIGLIQGTRPGRTVALRADMDALPVQEETGAPYASRTPGVMHACGHDGHTASLLTAANILSRMRDRIRGTVKLIFQPAEEATFADKLVEAGVMEGVDAIMGIHIWQDVEHGKIYIGAGEQMSCPIEFRITLTGEGGHGSQSHQAIDTIVPMAALIMNLQTIVSMEFNPLTDIALTIGRVYSGQNAYVRPGDSYNLVSGVCNLEGTGRAFNKEDSDRLQEKITRMLEGIEKTYRVKGSLYYLLRSPAVYNDPALAELGRKTCRSLWGEEGLDHPLGKVMASDDFGHYTKTGVPGLFAFVGSRNVQKLKYYPHHDSHFDIDEDAIEQSSCFYAQFALDYLNQG